MTTASLAVLEDATAGEVHAELARRRLRVFLEMVWPIIEEGTPFVGNWHVDALCDVLERVTRGEERRVLINVPPGTSKSTIVSVVWPAWEWARDPKVRFLTASYGQDLATRDAVRMRKIIEDPWFQRYFGHVQFSGDQNQKTRFSTTEGGFRIATSVGGRGTGEHPDRIIIDDPHNVKQAESDQQRQRAIDWFRKTISSRGASRRAAIVVIMQRLGERDLAGEILSGGDADQWLHVCLPMRAEPVSKMVRTKARRDPALDPRVEGELLWPKLFPEEVVRALEVALGSRDAAGQLQQRPSASAGNILKRQWWKYYKRRPERFDFIVSSCDPALKDKQQNDKWAIEAWGVVGADHYLLRADAGRWSTDEGMIHVRDMHRWCIEEFQDTPVYTVVERTAAGPEVVRMLKRKMTGVVSMGVKGDKVQRARVGEPVLEAGNVHVPGAADPDGANYDAGQTPGWVQAIIEELSAFPTGAEDDYVDAFSQAIIYAQRRRGGKIAMVRVEGLL